MANEVAPVRPIPSAVKTLWGKLAGSVSVTSNQLGFDRLACRLVRAVEAQLLSWRQNSSALRGRPVGVLRALCIRSIARCTGSGPGLVELPLSSLFSTF